ncbi:unnamed protein product, partial [Soboliphyme baturini]|uniref:Alpha-type protein kinase domain-containing protein n=1 Tax=Soboliphyme baturini TaxID=241478 RepID=A0A183IZN1_9BILA
MLRYTFSKNGSVRGNVVNKWRAVAHKALNCGDPWLNRNISSLPTELCQRHRYSAVCKKWVSDTVMVKMELEAFDRGAMRECYRLKKLNASSEVSGDWEKAMNYVAKRYLSDADREVYFEDVRLQMDAKLWSEEYNRHNPPKKVDIFQVSLLEFVNREGSPLFHMEHYIEGDYVKYNSNSGFVSSLCRQTPQTFSHFTFERSGHQMIVVDIQGVGDLYTDPQIHTSNGHGYGDGNLGTRGMALFFHSHICNSICRSLGLTPFDLAPSEKAYLNRQMSRSVVQALIIFAVCLKHCTCSFSSSSSIAASPFGSRRQTRQTV